MLPAIYAQALPQAPPAYPGSQVQPGYAVPGYAPYPVSPDQSLAPPPPPKRPGEAWLGLGLGNAVCDSSQPSSQCPVDGAGTLALGGAWRFTGHWALGLELGAWGFKVRDAWRGQLADPATDVKLSASYLAVEARWYWFDAGSIDPYLTFGVGGGAVHGTASNAGGTYDVRNSGAVLPLGIGVDFELAEHLRLGPQLLAYAQTAGKHCETLNGVESCRDGAKDEGALPWRLAAMLTVPFGAR